MAEVVTLYYKANGMGSEQVSLTKACAPCVTLVGEENYMIPNGMEIHKNADGFNRFFDSETGMQYELHSDAGRPYLTPTDMSEHIRIYLEREDV